MKPLPGSAGDGRLPASRVPAIASSRRALFALFGSFGLCAHALPAAPHPRRSALPAGAARPAAVG